MKLNHLRRQQERDRAIVNYLEQFKAATTSTLSTLFFPSLLTAQNRLKKLVEDYKIINRDREHISRQYCYYINTKPKQLKHRLLLTDFHREITKLKIKIVRFDNEFSFFKGIRPDGFLACVLPNGKKAMYFIETERSNKPDIEKYEELYNGGEWREEGWPTFPVVIWITNKKVPKTKLNIIHLKEDLSNINLLCRD